MGQHSHSQTLGVYPAYIWMGQIVDESTYIKNNATEKGYHEVRHRNDFQGYGYRYKVRIFGRDLENKTCTDEQLSMAEVLLPVTAGSGAAGSVQIPNLRQGNYVVGYYKDGIDATEPIIIGCLPSHAQTTLFGGDPDKNFVPRTGYNGKTGQKPLSNKNVRIDAPGKNELPAKESCDPYGGDIRTCSDQPRDGLTSHYIPRTYGCEKTGGAMSGIQKALKDAIAFINRIKSEANSFIGAASDLQNAISSVIDSAAKLITGLMKTLLDKMRGFVVNSLMKISQIAMDKFPPNTRILQNEAMQTAADTLQCAFNTILKGLFSLIQRLLTQIIDKFVNAPLCAVENFVGSLLSQILGKVNGAINSVISTLSSVLGKLSGILDPALKFLDTILGLLKFLTCEDPLDCTMGEQWSFWSGVKTITETTTQGLSKKLQNITNDIGGVNAPPCNTSQVPCGPPSIAISGGGGSGAYGNPIVSATGSLLGVDLVSGGTGYISPPNVTVQDGCGSGGGAVLYAVLSTPKTPSTNSTSIISGIGTDHNAGIGLVGIGTDLFSGLLTQDVPAGSGNGSFSGHGTYSDGTFSGTGIFIDDNRTFSVYGNFGGYDSSLVGSGTGNFYGTGTYENGRFNGTGKFVADFTGDNTVGATIGGTGGTATTGTGVIPLTVGGTGGSPVLANNTQITFGGLPVVSGGTGGTPVTVGGTGGIPLNVNGSLVTINGVPVTSGATGGIPVVIGNVDGTLAKVDGVKLTSSGNDVKSNGIFSGLSGGKTGEGTFGGPDGSSIEKIIVIDSGVGYLPAPNGSTGGNGFVFSNPDETILFNNKNGYTVYPPNSTIPVLSGDLIYMPPQTIGEVYDSTGNLLQSINGLGQVTPITIQKTGTITTPSYTPDNLAGFDPYSGSGSYPIVLQINDVLITNKGLNYSPEDQIKIVPDNGAKMTPKYDKFGRLISVNIDSTGIGFTDFPNLYIDSITGINAQIVPIFGSFRTGDLSELQDFKPEGVKVVQVVDCVGKVR